MGSRWTSLLIALLILTNLYTLRNYFELQRHPPLSQKISSSTKEDSGDFFSSLSRISSLVKEQQKILSQLIQNVQEGWGKATGHVEQINQQLQQLENEINELNQLKDKLKKDLEKQD